MFDTLEAYARVAHALSGAWFGLVLDELRGVFVCVCRTYI